MAALQFDVNLPKTPLTNGTPKTVVQVKAATNQRVKVLGFGFYTDGVNAANLPIQIRILTQSTAGTSLVGATPAAVEPELTETIQSTAQVGSQTTQTEPTAGTVRETKTVNGFTGQYEYLAPQGQELIIAGGTYLGFEASNPSGNPNMNIYGYVRCEE